MVELSIFSFFSLREAKNRCRVGSEAAKIESQSNNLFELFAAEPIHIFPNTLVYEYNSNINRNERSPRVGAGYIKMSSPIGGKRTVKIFVLYLMENINYPLEHCTINDIVMQTDYVMYLDFAECFNEMLDSGLITEIETDGKKYYIVSEKGRLVARELSSQVLSPVLDEALSAAFRYLDFQKRGITTECEVRKKDDRSGRYEVYCAMLEKNVKIFEATLTVDCESRARRMKENFLNRPDVIFRGYNALLAGNVNYIFG